MTKAGSPPQVTGLICENDYGPAYFNPQSNGKARQPLRRAGRSEKEPGIRADAVCPSTSQSSMPG